MAQVHLVGFGSQGKAWAENLRDRSKQASDSGAQSHFAAVPQVYLRPQGPSWKAALQMGFEPYPIDQLSTELLKAAQNAPAEETPWVVFLTPDSETASLYHSQVQSVPHPVNVVLAVGYPVYTGELNPAQLPHQHQLHLLAPKAIGPKLREAYVIARTRGQDHHRLVAAVNSLHPQLVALADALGFAPQNLVQATFEQEAVGDLLSEQLLLCGGVFTLLEHTLVVMREAGIPERLIREECLSELALVAGLVQERGAANTLNAISQAALAGATLTREEFQAGKTFVEVVQSRVRAIQSRTFATQFAGGEWKNTAHQWIETLRKLEGDPSHE